VDVQWSRGAVRGCQVHLPLDAAAGRRERTRPALVSAFRFLRVRLPRAGRQDHARQVGKICVVTVSAEPRARRGSAYTLLTSDVMF
jgi:hypothetical protein